MGNLFSRQTEGPAEFSAEWIENLHATRAAMTTSETDADEPGGVGGEENNLRADVQDGDGLDESKPKNNRNQAIFSADKLSAIKGMDNVNISSDALDAATVHLTSALMNLWKTIDKLKEMDVVVVARAVARWIKDHPWETAAIVVPLVLLACTPAFLGLAGFTAGGIAAGSIAAGVQAGIGSVAAGSVFATLTSAAMAGYEVPIVFGGVWLTSSAVMWGIAAWKSWRKDDAGGSNGAATTLMICDGNDDGKNNNRSVFEGAKA